MNHVKTRAHILLFAFISNSQVSKLIKSLSKRRQRKRSLDEKTKPKENRGGLAWMTAIHQKNQHKINKTPLPQQQLDIVLRWKLEEETMIRAHSITIESNFV